MIDQEKLNEALLEIAEKRTELSKMSYSDSKYDEIEDALHDLQDDFNENFGEYLEDIFLDVHDELCPDTDVLLPTAYLAKKYVEKVNTEDGTADYELNTNDGVYVDMDDYPDQETRLILVPNPVRILFTINGELKEEVWKQKS